ncbi:HpcH/HpaI aldolase/citrate lyase family protein [Rhizobium sp. SSA_523]|uniref:HpcH/HpaI aldolase family protein n=1 Tax=Rhizobium sp. SSA_523 TaxID=2952477 RepID=UPI002091DE83|nr:aldolase/citrate lyase family protein [Rhizobium sp. SSA_523]MCO5732547.1 aldolase/citrate lyase family protein [Rhizobium sp. SSA_523]WKC22315.1 aldolase/citrate lyase family protein [Rhizobium sp. SSA_523]
MFKTNSIKARLAAGETLFGCWVAGGSPTNGEILGHVGFDFLLVDHEHGVGEVKDAVDALRAIEATPSPAMLRVGWNDHVLLKRIADAGVQSVMIPSVDTPALAQAAVKACLYPPQGIRGYAASVVRASGYGAEPDYAFRANAEMLIAIQLESVQAIENAAEIAAIEGADIIFIGINDLAASMGLLGQTGHAEVQALAKAAESAILAAGKVLGTVPNAGANVHDLLERGYRFIPGPYDVALLRQAGLAELAGFREIQALRARGEAYHGGKASSY